MQWSQWSQWSDQWQPSSSVAAAEHTTTLPRPEERVEERRGQRVERMAGRVKVKVASYNIHGWVDADMQSNLERVAGVVARHDPDILCLQEVTQL